MKTNFYLLLTITLIFIAGCKSTSSEDAKFRTFEVKRGTNIAHFLSQSNARGEERRSFFTKDDVDLIASLGFDHIRLPVDEVQMWDEEMVKHDEAFELLHNVIQWCEDAGLRVIVDLHILRSHHFNEGEKPLWTDPEEQEKFIDIWRELSGELGKYPSGQVAYELMNEAVADDPEMWNDLIAKTVKAIRELEPERTIVIGSNRWQSADTFDDLRIPENDPHILLSFHFYSPFGITHYKAGWNSMRNYTGPVHYPGQVIKEEDLAGYTEEQINSFIWGGGYYTIDTLRKMMREPIAFARQHELPLYCGEFGVYHTAPREDGLRWYDDMITVLEENDIAWANWAYKGGYSIYEESGDLNEDLLQIFFKNTKE